MECRRRATAWIWLDDIALLNSVPIDAIKDLYDVTYRFSAYVVLLAILAVYFVDPALAQQKSDSKNATPRQTPVIAILDVQRIIQKSVANERARKELEGFRAKFDKELAAERAALAKGQEELKKKQLVLSKPAFERQRAGLERSYLAWRQKRDQINSNLNQAYAVVVRRIRNVMAKELAVLMKERSIDLTLARAAVLVFDERLNVTDEVVKRLNKTLPKIAISFDDKARPEIKSEKTQ